MRVTGQQAWCLSPGTVDVSDTSAAHAFDVVVVVSDTRLVSSSRIFAGQVDSPKQPDSGQVVDDSVNGLESDGGHALSSLEETVDLFSAGMRVVINDLECCEPLMGDAQSLFAQPCRPVVGRGGGFRCHTGTLPLFLVIQNNCAYASAHS